MPDSRWGEVGAAFLEPAPGVSLDAEAVKAWLSGRLARFKIPKHYLVEASLPRTASGKIDKALLKGRLSGQGASGEGA